MANMFRGYYFQPPPGGASLVLKKTKFNQSIGNWILNSDVNLDSMFHAGKMDCVNFANTFIGWSNNPNLPINRYISFDYGNSIIHPSAINSINYLTNIKGWTFSATIGDENCLALTNIAYDSFDVQIYPNPVSDYLYISYQDSIDKIEIYNLIGKKVFESTHNSQEIKINISQLETGVYFLKVYVNNENLKIYKIIKN